jgi:hypothetical protein|uniref:Minor tail protein n=1 Tax=Siphoviridae sp. ctGQT3 TaxID=2825412 RepID=A0A8S5UE39_9CAUD|nr:MAG TPA: minor tail protein [Siphoviridae sp. ctGQT3]
MDGSITIKTKIDSSGIEGQLEQVNEKIKIQEEKYKNTKDSLNEITNSLKTNNAEVEGMVSNYEKLNSIIKDMQTKADSPKGLSTSEYDELNKYIAEREKLGNSIDKVNAKIVKEESQQKKLTLSLKQQKLQYDQLIGKKQKLEVEAFKKNTINVGKMNDGIKQSIKSLSRYALALFSLSTIYSFLSSSASSWLSSNDLGAKQLSANIEYMKWAIGKSLQPVIETLVSWMYKLLQLIGMVANALFKVNIFSKASAKDFESSKKSTAGIAKNTKEASNNLASFDKLDVLQENKDSKSGGGSDFTMPTTDLGNMDMEVPGWMKWIVENGDLIISIIGGVTTAILLLKLGVGGLISLGIGIAIAGVIYLIQSVIKYLKDPSFENFGKVLTGIGLIIAGIAIAFGAWPVAIAGALVAIIGIIMSNWEKIKNFALGIGQWIEENFGLLGEIINVSIKNGLSAFEVLFGGVKQIFDGIIQIAKGDLAGGLKTIFAGIVNVIIGALNVMINALNVLISPARALIIAFGKVTGKNWNMSNIKIPSIPKVRLAKGAIVNNPRRGVDVNVGENGAEMMLPLENNTEWMDTLADKIASRTGGDRPLNIKATGTLSQLIRLLKLELDKEDDRRGGSMIKGGTL